MVDSAARDRSPCPLIRPASVGEPYGRTGWRAPTKGSSCRVLLLWGVGMRLKSSGMDDGSVRRAIGLVAAVLAVGFVLGTSPMGTAASFSGGHKVDVRVLQAAHARGSATYWVLLRQHADLSATAAISDRNTKGTFVVDRLRRAAADSQRGLEAYLRGHGASFRSFWIVNALLVTSDAATLQAVAARSEVASIVSDRSAMIPKLIRAARGPVVDGAEWNLINIRATKVWKKLGDRGKGIVVANIDTGVQYDHPALVTQYRGNKGGGNFDHNYNWFDPANICPGQVPCDNVAHGTQVMGLMVGDDHQGNKIGVAPKAKWIAAKGCESYSCTLSSLLASGQWVLAPTNLQGQNPRADLRPDVVNNSWGSANPSDPFYRSTVQAWVASGIFPVFAVGGSGPNCATVSSPASYPESYAVGAYDMNNLIASFSSRGPSPFGNIFKPNITAPGVNIRSSIPPNSYAIFSGASMAAPQLGGTVALIWSHVPSIRRDISGTRAVLDSTAINVLNTSCGGDAENNNVYGQGRLDAFAAVKAAQAATAAAPGRS